jgi:large subunit ribosomal protein L29
MSSVQRKPRRLERFRAKVKTKPVAEAQGKGKSVAAAAKVVNLNAALALKKKDGKSVKELVSLGLDELKAKLSEARKELFNLRFKKATGQLERVTDIPAGKKRVARILTLIRQKEVGA